jgi:hypothetical protein
MVTVPTGLSSAAVSNAFDLINSPLGQFAAVVVGLALIFIFLEIITGHTLDK